MHRREPEAYKEPKTNRRPSDTTSRRDNEHTSCKHCGYVVSMCVCRTDYVDFLEVPPEKMNKKIQAFVKNDRQVIDIKRRTPHSISGMKGIHLLKRINKR